MPALVLMSHGFSPRWQLDISRGFAGNVKADADDVVNNQTSKKPLEDGGLTNLPISPFFEGPEASPMFIDASPNLASPVDKLVS